MQSAGIVSVHDPPVPCRELDNLAVPIILRRFHPSRAPVFPIEMYDGEMQDLAQCYGEGCFAGTSRPKY